MEWDANIECVRRIANKVMDRKPKREKRANKNKRIKKEKEIERKLNCARMWYAIYLFWWPSIKQFMCQLLWSRGYLVAQTSEKWKILACFSFCECGCAFAKKIIIILNNFWLARAPYLFAGVEWFTFQQRTENSRSIFLQLDLQ